MARSSTIIAPGIIILIDDIDVHDMNGCNSCGGIEPDNELRFTPVSILRLPATTASKAKKNGGATQDATQESLHTHRKTKYHQARAARFDNG